MTPCQDVIARVSPGCRQGVASQDVIASQDVSARMSPGCRQGVASQDVSARMSAPGCRQIKNQSRRLNRAALIVHSGAIMRR